MGLSRKIAAFFRNYEAIGNFWQVAFARFYRKEGMIQLRLRHHPIELVMRTNSYHMFGETWINKDYDVKYLEIRQGDIVLDIGANQGFYTCYTANQGAQVFAFEPVDSTMKILEENIRLNGFENNVVAVQKAVGLNDSPVPLFEVNHLGGGMNTTQPGFAEYARGVGLEVNEMENVPGISIAEIAKEFNINRIRVCKLDCEGSELEILKNYPDWLIKETDAFIIEFHPNYDLKELTRLIVSWGTHQLSFADDLPQCERSILRAVANRLLV